MNALSYDYDVQALNFLEGCKATIKTKFIAYDKYFHDDDQPRDIYEVTIERLGRKPFVFRFGQSIFNSSGYVKKCADERIERGESFRSVQQYRKSAHRGPSDYDILAGITKYDPGTFEEFCSEYGYDSDSRKAEAIYFSVQKEFSEVRRIFGDVLEQLGEIS